MAHSSTVERSSATHARAMLDTHPRQAGVETSALLDCIEACFDCAQACTACADACLGEDDLKMVARCIRLNLDCAEVCKATGAVMTRQSHFDIGMARAVLEACTKACRICAAECEEHGKRMEHCRVCAEACRRCEASCERVVSSLAAA